MSRNRRQRSKRLSARRFSMQNRGMKEAAGGRKGAKRCDKAASKSTERRSPPRRPVLKFLFIFGILLALFYVFIAFSPFYTKRFMPLHHHWIAKISSGLLTVLGQDTAVTGASISSPRFSVNIIRGCDAVEPIALYVCAVLAFPLPFLKRIPGMIAGASLLLILNFVRIVSLFLIGVYSPRLFALTHLDVWQALFIFFAVLLWILWLLWATRSQDVTRLASS